MWLLPVLVAPLMLQDPSLNETSIAFSWGGYIWTVPREGGAARQITTGGHERNPVFSPDGSTIAFTGEYDGNVDVFTVPAAGGSPRRLTWHPGADQAVALPWMFRQEKIGPLVGMRTWGGLVGIYDYPPLMDGGVVTAPRIALYGLHGDWEVENVGIAPDVEVENDPASVAEGRDPQLERAVELTLEALKSHPVMFPQRPRYPNYHTTSENP